jgi:type IV secretory pathway VirB10-like protein
MHSIKFIVLLGTVTFIFQSASGLWSASIYTWTDKKGAVHITETPPPPGAAVEDVTSNPPESPTPAPVPVPVQPSPPLPPPSIGNWEVQQAEQQAQQAQEQLEAARQKAAEAEREAQQTIRQSEEYIDTHDDNPYMRRVFTYELKQAADAAQEAEAKAQEAAGQMKQAEQDTAAAQHQVQGAQEDAAIFKRSD